MRCEVIAVWGTITLSCFLLIVYTYAIYPMILIALARWRRYRWETVAYSSNELPIVSFIVAVYNEEKSIEEKIENCLQISYPSERIEFIFVSDGSTDGTNEILERYSGKGIHVHYLSKRMGKTAAQEFAIQQARGTVLVFSDASTLVDPDSVLFLVKRLQDPKIGLVSGEDEWQKSAEHRASAGQGLYVRYEMAIRKAESVVSTATASSGCFYAVRRVLRPNLDASLIDDFATPLAVIEKGFKVVIEPKARCYVPMTTSEHREFARKVRIVAGGVYALWKYRKLLNPFYSGVVAWQLWSHKVLRWAVPFVALAMFFSSFFWARESDMGKVFVVLETLFLLSAFGGWLSRGQSLIAKLVRVPFFLLMSNCAVLVGVLRCLLWGSPATWEPSRR